MVHLTEMRNGKAVAEICAVPLFTLYDDKLFKKASGTGNRHKVADFGFNSR